MNDKLTIEDGLDLAVFLDTLQDGVWNWNLEKNLIFFSNHWKNMVGYEDSEIGNDPDEWFSKVHPDDIDALIAMHNTMISGEKSEYFIKQRILHKDKTYHWVTIKAVSIYNKNGKAIRILGSQRDISEEISLKHEKIKLQRSEKFYRRLTERSSDITLIINEQGTIVYTSQSIKKRLEYDVDYIINKNIYDFIHSDDKETIQNLFTIKANSLDNPVIEFRIKNKDNSWCTFETLCTFMFSDVGISEVIMNSRDITERRNVESKLLYNTLYDELTGLPSKNYLMNYLDKIMQRSSRNITYNFVVLLLDLDGFKIITESLGYETGDELLIQVSKRLLNSIRTSDTLTRTSPVKDTIARLGGNEFVIILEETFKLRNAIKVVERIQKDLLASFKLNGNIINISASIGIVSGEHYETPENLLRDAHIAMSRARAGGISNYEVYDKSMHGIVLEQLNIESELRQALEQDEFTLYYQPIISLETGKVTGVEALLRWNSKKRGLVTPDQFIKITEETGLIIPLSSWVIEKACIQIKKWQNEFVMDPPLTMSINLSVKQFIKKNLTEIIGKNIKKNGLDPKSVSFEITENSIMENINLVNIQLLELKSINYLLYMDDFGTGYSSLNYLKHFPFDAIKIDRSFIRWMSIDEQSFAIVRTIIDLAKSMNMKVIAEGIETEENLKILRELMCDYGQGYLFSKPIDRDSMTRMLAGNPKW